MVINTKAVTPTTATTTQTASKKALDPNDFIKMMITQLQNQDPMEPAKSGELLAQMSQIGQLQSSNTLQDSLKTMVLQNQIGSAGNLIGKTVKGLNDNNEDVNGVVNSVKVQDGSVFLELDNGKQLGLGRVTDIASTTPAATTPAAAAA